MSLPTPQGSRPAEGLVGALPLYELSARRCVVLTEANKPLVRRFFEEID
jgi:hypothetical protein